MTDSRSAAPRQAGVVLIVVLFFVLLLTSGIATFVKRAAVDSMIARNRDGAARAEALARGGVRLAGAILLEDLLREQESESHLETPGDAWALVGQMEIETGDGAVLRLRIEDMGTRLNLNALPFGSDAAAAPEETGLFLQALLEKVIEELPVAPADKALYDPAALGASLIDWLDPDEISARGEDEDEYYQAQDPPYRAASRPLFSLEELRLIEGFDGRLVDGLRPYLTVYPWAPPPNIGGVNPNTAPPHVLALLFFYDGVSYRFVDEEQVQQILEIRADGGLLCGEEGGLCTALSRVVGPNPVFPPPSYSNRIFSVAARAQVGDVTRTAEAVLDRGVEPPPRLLSWRIR